MFRICFKINFLLDLTKLTCWLLCQTYNCFCKYVIFPVIKTELPILCNYVRLKAKCNAD